jgi:hypothetical protein
MGTSAAGRDEVWTVGEAATYLNAGAVDFGLDPRDVRGMAKDPGCLIRPISGGTGPDGRRSWYRLLASSVRAERARRLAEAGFDDPEWQAPEGVS